MKSAGTEPSKFMYPNVFSACVSLGALKLVVEIHKHIFDIRLELDVFIGSALIACLF